MSGPSFTFHYTGQTHPSLDQIDRAIGSSGIERRLRGERELHLALKTKSRALASMFVHVDGAHLELSPAERRAVHAAFGTIPERAVTGYVMSGGTAERTGLQDIAYRIGDKLGGWFVTRDPSALPTLTTPTPADEILIEVRDVDAFFGEMVNDRAYVRDHLELVPLSRIWFVAARHAARSEQCY